MSGFFGEINKKIAADLARAFDTQAFVTDLNTSAADLASVAATPMQFTKNSIAIRVDARMMPGWSPDELGPVERAKYDEEMRLFHIERNERTVIREAAWGHLRAIKDPAVRAVLDLHAMTDTAYDPECAHCYRDAEMGDREDWPCETVTAIANVYGIELPA